MLNFLTTKKTKIVKADHTAITLKGVNLGGWLMMEGYILHSLNKPEQFFKQNFSKKLGAKALEVFEKRFRENFIMENDIKNIASNGFNCIRVPFNCRLVEKAPYTYSQEGLKYIDKLIAWAKKYKIWVILDLHAAPGCQNHDWHSDSFGQAKLWHNKRYQHRTFALWEFLADRYKDEERVAGYDLLNEAVIDAPEKLNEFYKQLITTIRRVDKNHIFFVEGNKWAQDLDCLEDFNDNNIVLSVHFYEPLNFTFNLVPHLSYPLRFQKTGRFDKTVIEKRLMHYYKISQKQLRPIYVGEFGINYREGKYGEDIWLKDILSCFKKFGFHWTYWTYKAVKNGIFPDGIFSYFENSPWVGRHGPVLGWETYASLWPKHKNAMTKSWRTNSFSCNTKIFNILRNATQ